MEPREFMLSSLFGTGVFCLSISIKAKIRKSTSYSVIREGKPPAASFPWQERRKTPWELQSEPAGTACTVGIDAGCVTALSGWPRSLSRAVNGGGTTGTYALVLIWTRAFCIYQYYICKEIRK